MKKIFLLAAKPSEIVKYVVLGLISGFFSFLFVTLVNMQLSIVMTNDKRFGTDNVILFALVILLFIWSRKVLAQHIIHLSQKLFWLLRIKIIKQTLKADYQRFNQNKATIHASLVRDISVLTQGSLNLIQFISSVIMIVASFFYIATLDMRLFYTTLTTAVIGISIYQIGTIKNYKYFDAARSYEDKFLKYFNSTLSGFKELFLDSRKGNDILNKKINPISNHSINYNTKALVGFLNIQITGQVLFYSLICTILIYMSGWFDLAPTVVVKGIFLLLFLLGSIESVMVILPSLVQANVSAKRILSLKEKLDKEDSGYSHDEDLPRVQNFEHLEIRSLCYLYKNDNDKKNFSIGPIDLRLNQNEVVFIYGGNGSGKTTFIHTLLGLLKPSSGEISFNSIPLTEKNFGQYSTLFSAVFSDFFLFDELYGQDEIDLEKAKAYLQLFELDEKVQIQGEKFSTNDLSAGQRKRLALITALLEKKPILVLDEWAADQDPQFRQKFYEEIIPTLKSEGFTILAITHDDKYYDASDRLFKMEYGEMTEIAHMGHLNKLNSEP